MTSSPDQVAQTESDGTLANVNEQAVSSPEATTQDEDTVGAVTPEHLKELSDGQSPGTDKTVTGTEGDASPDPTGVPEGAPKDVDGEPEEGAEGDSQGADAAQKRPGWQYVPPGAVPGLPMAASKGREIDDVNISVPASGLFQDDSVSDDLSVDTVEGKDESPRHSGDEQDEDVDKHDDDADTGELESDMAKPSPESGETLPDEQEPEFKTLKLRRVEPSPDPGFLDEDLQGDDIAKTKHR